MGACVLIVKDFHFLVKKMNRRYSNEEKFDILVTYIRANRNAHAAVTAYSNAFPERSQPSERYFKTLVQNLLQHGSFDQPRINHQPDEVRNNTVLNAVENNSSISVRQIATTNNIPKSSVHRILKKRKFHPYKPLVVQGLRNGDFERRVAFSRWYVESCGNDRNFQSKVI